MSQRPDDLADALVGFMIHLDQIRDSTNPVEQVKAITAAIQGALDVSITLTFMRGEALHTLLASGLSELEIATLVGLTETRVHRLLTYHHTRPDVIGEC